MTKIRTHLLLEPEQHKALTQLAQQEGRSVSDLAREIVQTGIEERQMANRAQQLGVTWVRWIGE
jgi:predicted DNA-binding protein